MSNMHDIQESVAYIRSRSEQAPEYGVLLGTGMGQLMDRVEEPVEIPYNFIPHFPTATVQSHAGKLVLGRLGGKPVAVLAGRFHYYEGYDLQQVTYPLRVLKQLGVHTLLNSSAAGCMNLNFQLGDLVVMKDHIGLFLPDNPLRGANLDEMGPRFPDMSAPYDAQLRDLALNVGQDLELPMQTGVYVAVPGPNLETPAEYRLLRNSGADMVGMSTIPETIVARHQGQRMLAIAVATDMCDPDNLQPLTVEDVIATASAAEPKLAQLFIELLNRL